MAQTETSTQIVVGAMYPTKKSGKVKVLEYHSSAEVVVQFKDGSTTTCRASHLRTGGVKNPNTVLYGGKAQVGIGNFSKENNPAEYGLWISILARCHGSNVSSPAPTMEKRWLNFQNFCQDLVEMKGYDQMPKGWQFTKTVLDADNNHWGPKFCAIVPPSIRTALRVPKDVSGRELSVGVSKFGNRYKVQEGRTGKYKGSFATPEEAAAEYLTHKRARLKELANQYKSSLDPRVRKILLNY